MTTAQPLLNRRTSKMVNVVNIEHEQRSFSRSGPQHYQHRHGYQQHGNDTVTAPETKNQSSTMMGIEPNAGVEPAALRCLYR